METEKLTVTVETVNPETGEVTETEIGQGIKNVADYIRSRTEINTAEHALEFTQIAKLISEKVKYLNEMKREYSKGFTQLYELWKSGQTTIYRSRVNGVETWVDAYGNPVQFMHIEEAKQLFLFQDSDEFD